MRITFFTAAVAALFAAAALAPIAIASDEAHADCEDDQPWIGYQTTDPARAAVQDLALPARADACEGEQWDGQDSVARGWGNSDEPSPSCFAHDADPASPRVTWCADEDPNPERANLVAADPAHLRASARPASDSSEAYALADASSAAMIGAYAGACVAGGAGLEGAEACEGQAQARGGVYFRDNTLFCCENLIFRMLYPFSITPPPVAEADCDQETYERSAYEDRHACWRDNTAFGAEAVLP